MSPLRIRTLPLVCAHVTDWGFEGFGFATDKESVLWVRVHAGRAGCLAGVRVQGLGTRVEGSGFRDESGFRTRGEGSGFRV